jgi:CDP-diacylglycerol--glycerol-3-phosphate 3-phosphatidyltransferase
MNLPNKLTVARMCLIPFFMIFAFPVPEGFPGHEFFAAAGPYIALVIYIVASVTDAADGHIARKNHLVTSFGKFLDPIADKLLVTAALLALVPHNHMYLWAAMVILAREFIVTGMRLLAAGDGVVIAAGKLGKIKMVLQTVSIITLLCAYIVETWTGIWTKIGDVLVIAGDVLMWGAVIMTIVSGIEYVAKNINYLKKDI